MTTDFILETRAKMKSSAKTERLNGVEVGRLIKYEETHSRNQLRFFANRYDLLVALEEFTMRSYGAGKKKTKLLFKSACLTMDLS